MLKPGQSQGRKPCLSLPGGADGYRGAFCAVRVKHLWVLCWTLPSLTVPPKHPAAPGELLLVLLLPVAGDSGFQVNPWGCVCNDSLG